MGHVTQRFCSSEGSLILPGSGWWNAEKKGQVMDRASVMGTCQCQSQELQAETRPTSKATFPIRRLPMSPQP